MSDKKITRPASPADGPSDGVQLKTECIRTDFLENPDESGAVFTQRDKTEAHVSASMQIGIFSIRDMDTGVMLTVSIEDAMSVIKEAADVSKGEANDKQ